MKNLLVNIKKILFRSSCICCLKNETEDCRICNECLKKLKYSSSIKNRGDIYYIWKYDDIVKNMIESQKFNGIRDSSKEIANIIEEKLKYIITDKEIDYVIPVPISKERERERGFNQVEDILINAGINYLKAERKVNTKHMYKILNKNRRSENIKNCFKLPRDIELNNKRILIFDDIVTTGATFFEIRREIEKGYTPKQILLFTLAAAKYSINKGVDSDGNE